MKLTEYSLRYSKLRREASRVHCWCDLTLLSHIEVNWPHRLLSAAGWSRSETTYLSSGSHANTSWYSGSIHGFIDGKRKSRRKAWRLPCCLGPHHWRRNLYVHFCFRITATSETSFWQGSFHVKLSRLRVGEYLTTLFITTDLYSMLTLPSFQGVIRPHDFAHYKLDDIQNDIASRATVLASDHVWHTFCMN